MGNILGHATVPPALPSQLHDSGGAAANFGTGCLTIMNLSSGGPLFFHFRLHRPCGAALAATFLALFFGIAVGTPAQEVQSSRKLAPPANQVQAPQTSQPQAGLQAKKKFNTGGPEHEDADQLKRREAWFYKQRADSRGRIPAGARLKAFQHMQSMMEAEGKLVRQPNGSFAAVTPQAGSAVGGTWSALGPAPTTGGFFSPVSGRIEAIAVDPSDTTGNTVLVGGAQGGIWRSTDGGATWTPTGDSNPSLAMGSIAFANPTSPGGVGVVYAGTGEQASIGFDIYYGAGVLKSTNGGLTWTQTCNVASSTCPFIGPFTNTLNFGFFNDGGARISYIAVNPQNANLVLVGAQIPRVGGTVSETAGGIYCSSDGGATWTSLLIGEAGSFVGFATPTIAYAALGRPFGNATGAPNPNGIYKSTNANASSCSAITFNPVATQPTTSAMGRIDLGIAASDATGNTLYASIANGSNGSSTNLGVFVTTNGGTSWTQTLAPDICRFQCWYDNVVKVDPANAGIVYIGGGAAASATAFEWVMRSTNGTTGGTFSPAIPTSNGGNPALPHVDQHAMAFFKATTGTFAGKVRLYLGNDGGLWRTDDAEAATVAWTNLNQNLTLTQFYPSLSPNPSNPAIAYGGAQDNGSQVFQGTPNWTDNQQCGDGGQTAVDFQVPTTVYVDCQDISLSVSGTGGTDPASYVSIGNGINPNGADSFAFIPPIATDPSTAGRVYFGTDHVYQSSDNGSNFTAISGVLPTRIGNYLTALGVSPNNPAVIYAGGNGGGVFLSTNATSANPSFTGVGVNQLPLRNVTALVVDPADATGMTAYVTFSGFAAFSQATGTTDTLGHVFKTINGGAAWTDVSCTNLGACQTPNATTDLPNIPVNDVVVDPDVPGTIYAATDIGAFQGTCTAAGCTWNTLGTGLPNVAVLSLKLHEASRTLVAGTHGRGAWSLVLANFSFPLGPHVSSISPISAQVGSASFTLTVDGSGLTGATAVQWKAGGITTALTPTAVTASQVTTTVPTSLLAVGGTAQVSVSVGATNSNSLTFGVLSAPPTISSVSPTSAPVNTNGQAITVAGTNFATNSQVILNPDFIPGPGQPNGQVLIPTTFVSSTQLSATIPASFLANFGSTNSVGVRTPPPGGGTTSGPPPAGTGTTPLPTFVVVAPPPANDNFANAINITPNSFTDTKDTSAATTETTDPNPGAVGSPPCVQGTTTNGRSNSIWYKFTPTSSGTLDLTATGSNYDTVLSIWTGSPGSFTFVACNNGLVNPGIVLVSQLHGVLLSANTTYFIMVSSFGPPDPNPVAFGAMNVLNFTFTPPPFTLTAQAPTSVTVTAGNPATYMVAVAPNNGFTGTVNLSCTLPAAATTCSVTPPSVTLGAGQNVTVTVTTTKHSALPPLSVPLRQRPFGRTAPLVFIAMLALLLALFAARTRRQRLALSLPLAALVLLLVFQAAGCSGGGSGGGGGTLAGTYTVTVTGTSGTTSAIATVTLVVN